MADVSLEGVRDAMTREIGETGLKHTQGWVHEEQVPELRTLRQRMRTYKKMLEDSTVASMIFLVEQYVRSVDWGVRGEGAGRDLLEASLDAMEQRWQEFITEVLSMVPYGFCVNEIVFQEGPEGQLLWKKFPIRGQESIHRWEFDEKGDLRGLWQMPPYGGREIFLPRQKFMLFRASTYKNNPEGKGALRTAYRPWYFKTKLEVTEAIGLDRELTGYPVLQVPGDVFADNKIAAELRALAQDIVTRIRKDEQMGCYLPESWELTLLSAPGTAKPNTSEVINRYDIRIAQAVLADITMLGHRVGGSYALGEQKHEMFITALQGWVDTIAEVFNREAVSQLMELNGVPEPWPEMRPERIARIDPQKLANIIFRLVGVQALTPDGRLEEYLRDFLGLPEPEPETIRGGEEVGLAHGPDDQREDAETRPADTRGEFEQG